MEYSYCEALFSLQKKPNFKICNNTNGFLKHRKKKSIIKLFHMVKSGSSKYQLAMMQFFVIMRLTSVNMCSEIIEREIICEYTLLYLFCILNIVIFSSEF